MALSELTAVVVLTGIIIVFAILFILTLVTNIYGKVINLIRSKFNKEKTAQNTNSKFSVKNNKSSQNMDEEIVAVIGAAIYESNILSNTKKYAIKSISLTDNNSISSWKLSGLLENTNIYEI